VIFEIDFASTSRAPLLLAPSPSWCSNFSRGVQTSFAEQQKMGQVRKGYKRKKNEMRYATAMATAADAFSKKRVPTLTLIFTPALNEPLPARRTR
jgi:hypothetical protein